jgi:hypothetical protein
LLSSHDRRQFNVIVAGLLAEDPELGTRHQPPAPRPPRPLLAMALWMSMPFLVTVGGWTGLLVAVIAAIYGVHLWSRGGVHRSARRVAGTVDGTPPEGAVP